MYRTHAVKMTETGGVASVRARVDAVCRPREGLARRQPTRAELAELPRAHPSPPAVLSERRAGDYDRSGGFPARSSKASRFSVAALRGAA